MISSSSRSSPRTRAFGTTRTPSSCTNHVEAGALTRLFAFNLNHQIRIRIHLGGGSRKHKSSVAVLMHDRWSVEAIARRKQVALEDWNIQPFVSEHHTFPLEHGMRALAPGSWFAW